MVLNELIMQVAPVKVLDVLHLLMTMNVQCAVNINRWCQVGN
jgi:hypothetical protein